MFKESGVYFWNVGNGDSTSIVIQEGVVFQVDLNSSQSDDNDNVPVAERLIEHLQAGDDGKPYLPCFALTHPDEDHVKGFKDLLDKVTVGELWFSPFLFHEDEGKGDNKLCEDAMAFRKEARRRVELACDKGAELESGDRVRIVRNDALLKKHLLKNFPEELFIQAGERISEVDGEDYNDRFSAFIHSPFTDDEEFDRNARSLAMQVVLGDDAENGGVLLFGDLSYPEISRIFAEAKANGYQDALKWQALLAPHHCSRKVMYHDEGTGEGYKSNVMECFEAMRVGDGTVISSSRKFEGSDEQGDDPPHKDARDAYLTIIDGEFLCTSKDAAKKENLFLKFDGSILAFVGVLTASGSEHDFVTTAIRDAEGDRPPKTDVAFGKWR